MLVDVIAPRRKNLLVALVSGVIGVLMGWKCIGGIPIYIHEVTGKLRAFRADADLVPLLLVSATYLVFLVMLAVSWYISVRTIFPRTVEGTITSVSKQGDRFGYGYVFIHVTLSNESFDLREGDIVSNVSPENWNGKQARLTIAPLKIVYALQVEEMRG